ncbi:glycoside hydrolase family 13 protein [Peribacillus asahii]|uniref:Alpha-amylase n=1 Tax=Peribacillus asahii TaxID=228899 RepID=A0A3Q9RKY8_9BACI|nr:alpha-glucosidase [Peribacillus asahii]AZV41654.1 oligo-1,6-glucosidase [Peribacillus asahii]USK86004.1 alpha-glucosidase [Peribacillus asahii]
MKKRWWKEAVCYQIYPRSFQDSNGDGIGDLQGVISRLDYLHELGIDVLWICPFFQSPNADNGYDISDYQAVAQEFGTMDDLEVLVEEVHRRGMKIILDLVLNHTSDEHPWFIDSRSSQDHPKRDWYIWRDGKNGKEPNNWESIFSGSAWTYDEQTKQYYLHLFAEKQPDLNWKNANMRSALYDMVNWWLEKGIDGFRVDAITHIYKRDGLPNMPNPDGKEYVPAFDMHTNQDGILDYLEELKTETFANHDIMTVGEANGVRIEQADDWVGAENGKFNMIFQFEHLGLWNRGHHETVDVPALKQTLSKWQYGLHNKGWNALFFENHDQPRIVSTWGDDTQYWLESAKMIGALYFLMQGTPFIYQGQEIGMTNVQFASIDDYDDVGMKNYYRIETAKGRPHEEMMQIIWKSGRDNSRTPMQWDSSANAGFTKGTPWMKVNKNYPSINVANQITDGHSIYTFYKKLIELRKQYEVFIYGAYELVLEDDPQIYAYIRRSEGQAALVVCNFSKQKQSIDLSSWRTEPTQLLLANYKDAFVSLEKNTTLRPYEVLVYLL